MNIFTKIFNLIKTIVLIPFFMVLVVFVIVFFAFMSLITYYKHKDEI